MIRRSMARPATLTAMGVDLEQGVLRMSSVHYTSAEDVARLIAALDEVG